MNASLRAEVQRDVLPATIPVTIADRRADAPSALLAVHSPTPAGAPRRVALHPAHGVVYAAMCANLPPRFPLAPGAAPPASAGFIFVKSIAFVFDVPRGASGASERARATKTPPFSAISRLCRNAKYDW